MTFEVHATDGRARTGTLELAHGVVRTPAFMPVGTAATVKAMMPQSVRETGADILLGNTYHLMLRPSAERIAALGGLHRFMDWDRPILTDSGGFQVMSLAGRRQIDADGVTFKSHIDGSEHRLTPARSIEIQRLLGADITMVLDECTPHPATHDEAVASLRLSMDWAGRSKQAFEVRDGHKLFGIVQGSTYADLRRDSAAALVEIGFDGYAVGGLAVGEPQDEMFAMIEATEPILTAAAPRYLMGVGKPDDIVGAVRRGIDMFDCVLPTRSGRNAQAFTWDGPLNLRNARHAEDIDPIDPDCRCPACRQFSRAYLNHLTKTGEILGAMLLTWHNLTFYQDLMAALRQAIAEARLDAFVDAFHARYPARGTARDH
ncbi:MAG: tRNA guanosine(34) transglycosylase Tgt [Alphaproteobacteria bacterium]